MKRGSKSWLSSTRQARRINRRHTAKSSRCRLFVELLEDRRLLATASLNDLALDTGDHRASSLIVKFREGANSAGSLAAYVATANLDPEWSLTPGMHKVELDPSADFAATLAAYRQDPNVEFAEPDYHVSLEDDPKVPNDPNYGDTWGLNNIGQTLPASGHSAQFQPVYRSVG